MELTTNFKTTDIGIVPEEWDVIDLGRLGEPLIGLTYSPNDVREYGTLVLRASNIQNGKLNLADTVYVDMELPSRVIVEEGDLLICVRNGSRQLIGKCLLLDKRVEGSAFGAFMSVIRSDFSKFIYFQFQSDYVQRQIGEVMGATINQLTNKNLKEFLIPFPPTTGEQEAITEALSDVDDLIESLEQRIAKKRLIKQGTMQALLSGGKRLSGFEDEWEEKTLGDLFEISGGVSASREQLGFEGYCYLHYGDIHATEKSIIDLTKEFASIPKLNVSLSKISSPSLLNDGDIVFVDASEDIIGASKHVVVVNPENIPFISGLHTIVAKPKSNDLTHLYLRYCFQTKTIRDQFQFFVVGTKVSGISKSNIKKIRLPVPSPAEQQAIASILSDMDAEIDEIQRKLSKTREIKLGMMQQLLTGKIRLIQPASNVSKSTEQKQIATTHKPHSIEFEDAVIIAVLAACFASAQWPLSRFRYTKFSYLLRRRSNKAVNSYLKKAAGPYNPRTRYGGPERITVQKSYSQKHSNGTYSGFLAGEKIEEAEKYFETWFGKESLTWLKQFQFEKHDQLELLTTVDMAIVELRKDDSEVSLESVKQLIHSAPEWAPKLDRSIFSDVNIDRAIKWSANLFGA